MRENDDFLGLNNKSNLEESGSDSIVNPLDKPSHKGAAFQHGNSRGTMMELMSSNYCLIFFFLYQHFFLIFEHLISETTALVCKRSKAFHLTLYHTIPTFKDYRIEALENAVGKEENAGNQHFLLFPQCFLLCQREKSSF